MTQARAVVIGALAARVPDGLLSLGTPGAALRGLIPIYDWHAPGPTTGDAS